MELQGRMPKRRKCCLGQGADMWKMVLFYLPDWKVFMQGFIAFVVPYVLSRFFKWIHHSKEDEGK